MTTHDWWRELHCQIEQFSDDRQWQRFHSPKNLSMALCVEAGELMEHFQWLSEQDSLALADPKKHEVAMEMADVFIYLIRMAQRLQIDLPRAALEKMQRNAEKYPIALSRGRAEPPPYD